jgi:hypothetical protein
MFLGHFAVGFAAKRLAPRTSLGVLVAAPIALDLLWPVFLLLGWERARVVQGENPFLHLAFDHYPWSHSLAAAVGWSLAAGLGYWAVTRYPRGAIVIALGVSSHWLLDVVTHIPDLPLVPGGPVAGFGLWRSPAATIALEAALFAAGVAVYTTATRAAGGLGRWAWWGLVALLALVYAASAAAPPPPSLTAVAYAGILGGSLSIALAAWADRRRVPAAGQ